MACTEDLKNDRDHPVLHHGVSDLQMLVDDVLLLSGRQSLVSGAGDRQLLQDRAASRGAVKQAAHGDFAVSSQRAGCAASAAEDAEHAPEFAGTFDEDQMMAFATRFQGNEHDRSGTASFSVGTIKRDVHFADSADFLAVSQLLNEAYELGRKASAQDLLALAHELARRAGV
jgi:hypothetical protein